MAGHPCWDKMSNKATPVTMNGFMRLEDGTILILVLWVIAMVTMVAGYFSQETRLRGNLGHGSWNLLKSRMEMESVLNLVALYVAPVEQDQDKTGKNSKDTGTGKPETSTRNDKTEDDNKNSGIGRAGNDQEKFIIPDGSSYKVMINGRALEFTLEDERGKIDINKVPDDMLETVMESLLQAQDKKLASDITDCILDWKDNDDDKRTGGAEKDYYESLSPAYHPANSKFLLLEQLLLVKGIDPRLYWGPIKWKNSDEKDAAPLWKGGIQDIFTVYNGSTTVNRASAPRLLTEILDESELTSMGGLGTMRLKACLYQGCYQVFWRADKQQGTNYTLVHWQQVPMFD